MKFEYLEHVMNFNRIYYLTKLLYYIKLLNFLSRIKLYLLKF